MTTPTTAPATANPAFLPPRTIADAGKTAAESTDNLWKYTAFLPQIPEWPAPHEGVFRPLASFASAMM